MKIKEIRYDFKKGMPNFSSVAVGLTAQLDDGEDVDKAFDALKQEANIQCDNDPSFMRSDKGVTNK